MKGKIFLYCDRLSFLFYPIIFFLCWLKASNFLDPDFGWHLRTGQLILSSAIPRIDPFSYTMPTYPYVDHAWLADVFIAVLFPFIGFPGLSLVFTVITFAAVFIVSRSRLSNILALTVFLSSVSVRPLVFTWFFFAVLLRYRKKWRWAVPLLFLLWGNLHGGFVAGLIIVTILDPFIAPFCLIATLINPYGFGLWREVWTTLSDQSLRSNIAEWQTTFYWFHPSFLFLVVLSVASVVKYWGKFALKQKMISLAFLFSGFLYVRNVPLLVLADLPIINSGLKFFRQEVSKDRESSKRFAIANRFLLAIILLLFVLITALIFLPSNHFIGGDFYPKDAVSFLHNHLPAGNIFAPYGWGGYLIWKLPEKKVFIDGRMPSWQLNGYSAFRQSQKIANGEEDSQPVFENYHIDTVLWPVPQQNLSLDGILQERIDALFGIKPSGKDLGERLLDAGWMEVYRDSVAVVYKKPGG